jgi:uncharacterized protein (TIGR00255 family)
MTGFGDARRESDRIAVTVEVRTVNNRYLKVTVRCSEGYNVLEPQVEKVVRETVGRGTVNVTLRVERLGREEGWQLSREAISSYVRQAAALASELRLSPPASLGELLTLPGVVAEGHTGHSDPERDWPLIEDALKEALRRLDEFRVAEGRSMQDDLRANVRVVEEQLRQVVELTPTVVAGFRDRLLERVRELLQTTDVQVDPSDLIREVSIYSERADVNEETTRLRSHLEQFAVFLDDAASSGRKLDFLTQEMFREVNTIGSKANNVAIAHCVVEMKAAVEKIREVLQNVE